MNASEDILRYNLDINGYEHVYPENVIALDEEMQKFKKYVSYSIDIALLIAIAVGIDHATKGPHSIIVATVAKWIFGWTVTNFFIVMFIAFWKYSWIMIDHCKQTRTARKDYLRDKRQFLEHFSEYMFGYASRIKLSQEIEELLVKRIMSDNEWRTKSDKEDTHSPDTTLIAMYAKAQKFCKLPPMNRLDLRAKKEKFLSGEMNSGSFE